MTDTSTRIFERFRRTNGKDIDLTLRPAYRGLLDALGNPHNRLPPVFHVAGTNGKGSTCAFLRSVLEAAGYRVHIYTSPHLVTLHERIRLAGKLIEEEELVAILTDIDSKAQHGSITFFEAMTTAAFVAMTRHPADFVILETGLGGRLDATNVLKNPLATIITRVSCDHREYLGDTVDKIAYEKAGIMRPNVPCFVMSQPDKAAEKALRTTAQELGAPLILEEDAWRVEKTETGFRFIDTAHTEDLPDPSLLGKHQYHNAGLALAALSVITPALPLPARANGMRNAEWPARLQCLGHGTVTAHAPAMADVWIDGGHNDSAGDVLKEQIEQWHTDDGTTPRPLYVIMGMLSTKDPAAFLKPFAPTVTHLSAVPIPNDSKGFDPSVLADNARALGIRHVASFDNVNAALENIPRTTQHPPRILICGSLYLAGSVLAEQSV